MCPYADRPDAIPLANIFAERPLSAPASSQPRSPVVGFGVVVDNVQRSVRLIDLRVPAAGFPTRPNRRCTCRHGSELRPFIKIVRRHHRDPARSEFSPVSNMLIVLSVVLLVSSAFNIEAETPPDGAAGRAKRQLPPIEEGNQVIDNIFQVRTSRPFDSVREYSVGVFGRSDDLRHPRRLRRRIYPSSHSVGLCGLHRDVDSTVFVYTYIYITGPVLSCA